MADDQKEQVAKDSFGDLARKLNALPTDKKRAALETSAAIAGVSLRVSRDFVEAVPAAAKLLSADDLKNWGELGRRLAMASADVGSAFFSSGTEELAGVPEDCRPLLFRICTKQLVLSTSTATETFKLIPKLAERSGDSTELAKFLELALEVANRSAKHSADYLANSISVAEALERFEHDREFVADAWFSLGNAFAERTGGMTADLWAAIPDAIEKLNAADSLILAERSLEMLDLGGSVTLHFVSSGSKVLTIAPHSFAAWSEISFKIGKHGNSVLISFLRSTPGILLAITRGRPSEAANNIAHMLAQIDLLAEIDAESALAAFRSSSDALAKVSVKQFESWIAEGIEENRESTSKARRSYFALETRESAEKLHRSRLGLDLDRIGNILRLYVEALTGREVGIEPLSAISQESRIGDGKTIYLPSSVGEFPDDETNFRLYKVLAAHGSGQIEFGTFVQDSDELKAAYSELKSLYSATSDQLDAFSLAGYIEDVQKGESARPDDIPPVDDELPTGSDYRAIVNVFPEPRLARKIFGTMENARIDHCLRNEYRGLVKDLDLMRTYLRENRPYIFDVPMHQVPFELLFQITMCGGATDDAKMFYSQIVSEIESVIETFFHSRLATADSRLSSVADSLMATSRVYDLFQNISPEQLQESDTENREDEKEFAYEDKEAAESVTEDKVQRERERTAQDVSDLFNAWNSLDDEGEPDDLSGAEAWSGNEMPEMPLEPDDIAFSYDEWDRDLNDYRVGWSRVIEKKVKQGDRNFVELARSRYKGVISSIRHQFQLMKPENLTKINREFDGEDYDLNALVDFVIDRRADGKQAENIYTKRLRKQRDVAVSLLLDQSSSTARTITRNPLQPYTHPGRRIIEIEKEGLVLMSEALEAVGDTYSINGFTSDGRRNVKFYVVKDFNEKYSDEIEKRIGGITFQNNTRLGAAIRHAAHKLLRQESRTKLLIILTDGRPYDHDYGDARYAREDVREALTEAKMCGITPFCITIDRESESELRDLYGNVGYTIIDDVLSLPERMPNIYRRLTS